MISIFRSPCATGAAKPEWGFARQRTVLEFCAALSCDPEIESCDHRHFGLAGAEGGLKLTFDFSNLWLTFSRFGKMLRPNAA